ncbi:hypothetical protein V6N11_048322 [Hibiscus sabdariffa]|uniref:Protein kinase domain-containing protein n=1 Tax=Hibiscus sabdariffa TaxID=183260 RepID=A0ABR2PUX7_9ROSI
MSCFSCCGVEVQHRTGSLKESAYGIVGNGSNNNGKSLRSLVNSLSSKTGSGKQKIAEEIEKVGNAKISAHVFTFRELVAATDNFNPVCLIGEDLPPGKEPLDWTTRMKVAEGAAKGLEYLHDFSDPRIIYRDFKASNILLDENFNPKLSDFGLAKLGPTGGKDHVSTRVMGTYGYCAPEYAMTGQLTTKSDVYSFGVVFLELISGRRAIDILRPEGEQNLVAWAEPLLKDRHKFTMIADPLLEDNYPVKALYQALAVAAMCLQEDADSRPLIGDVVTAVEFLAKPKDTDRTAAESQRNTGLHVRSVRGGSFKRDRGL